MIGLSSVSYTYPGASGPALDGVSFGIEEGEFRDRSSLGLPGHQEELIARVAATGTPTVVELEFRSVGAAHTEVLLEHRGWEALSERELGEDCALPGGYLGGSFSAGWAAIFTAFSDALAGPSDDHDLTKVGGEPTERDAE